MKSSLQSYDKYFLGRYSCKAGILLSTNSPHFSPAWSDMKRKEIFSVRLKSLCQVCVCSETLFNALYEDFYSTPLTTIPPQKEAWDYEGATKRGIKHLPSAWR